MKQIDNEAMFRDAIRQSDKPVLVDFWAPWCGPCKMVAPVLEALEQEKGDQLAVVQANVDDHMELAKAYGLRAVPTLMLFNNGDPVGQHAGVLSKEQLAAWVGEQLPPETATQ